MLTYTTLEGDIIDLQGFTRPERDHFDRSVAAYEAGMDWARFMDDLVTGEANPLIDPGRRITQRTLDSPLYRVLCDLGNRLGITQGKFRPAEGDDPASDPLHDVELAVTDAATRAGVSFAAVYAAIARGDLIATRTRPMHVSERSLRRWTVNEARQAAGRKSARRAS